MLLKIVLKIAFEQRKNHLGAKWLGIVFDRGKRDQWYALDLNFNQEFRE
jgi:hypothetical protein